MGALYNEEDRTYTSLFPIPDLLESLFDAVR